MERALLGGFPGVPPERRGARTAAAMSRLARSEAVGGTARTPCAFAERGVRLTVRSCGAGREKVRWGHPSPSRAIPNGPIPSSGLAVDPEGVDGNIHTNWLGKIPTPLVVTDGVQD